MKSFTLINLLFGLVILSGAVFAQTGAGSRDPFVLELPGISDTRYIAPVIRLRQTMVPSLRFRVLEPFARSIQYGRIVATVNGEGINRGCDKKADLEGTIVHCFQKADRLNGFELDPGKNIVEISATDKTGREYYASYVLLLGDKTAVPENSEWAQGKAEQFHGRKFALIIGISEYLYTIDGLKNLRFADKDAQAIADFLRTPAGGAFAAADVKLLLNRNASLIAVRSALDEIARQARSPDLVFIFIAGHGAPDPLAPQNLYFLLTDTKVLDMPNTGFPMSELKQTLDTRISAHRAVVLVDTCHSAGVNQRSKSIITGRDLVQEDDENNISNFYLTKQLFKQTGRAVITSSDVNEVSQESQKWGDHGVFTWALLEGLKGEADTNKDKLITTGELFRYTLSTVRSETGNRQNPRALPGTNQNLTLAFTGVN